MEVYIVIGFQTFSETVFEQVEVCKDEETADNYSLDFIERGWEVQRFRCLLKDMKTYNK